MEITITIKADKEELPALKGQNEPKETTRFEIEAISQYLMPLLRKALQFPQDGAQDTSCKSA